METRLLARLLATARTVTALGAVTPTREVTGNDSEPVRAQVAARLADGTFRVFVDGRAALKLALPAGVKPGDVIELLVVNRNGRQQAEFMGMRTSEGGALSATGRLISALLSEHPAPAQPQAKPILPLPPTVPGELPEPLARAVETSGMFYESHQARWVEGDYPLQRLQQEPQAQLRALVSAGEASRAAPQAPQTQASMQPALPAEADGAAGEAPAAGSPAPQLRTTDDAQPVAREALALVRNQLETLESRQLTWLGEIWPGQPMRWQIEADDSRDGGENDARPGWNTRLSLALPQLGEVDADIAIGALGVRLNLKARTPHVAGLMRESAPGLVQALTAAGMAPVQIKVSCDEPAS